MIIWTILYNNNQADAWKKVFNPSQIRLGLKAPIFALKLSILGRKYISIQQYQHSHHIWRFAPQSRVTIGLVVWRWWNNRKKCMKMVFWWGGHFCSFLLNFCQKFPATSLAPTEIFSRICIIPNPPTSPYKVRLRLCIEGRKHYMCGGKFPSCLNQHF